MAQPQIAGARTSKICREAHEDAKSFWYILELQVSQTLHFLPKISRSLLSLLFCSSACSFQTDLHAEPDLRPHQVIQCGGWGQRPTASRWDSLTPQRHHGDRRWTRSLWLALPASRQHLKVCLSVWCAYIQLFEDGVLFYPREHDSHRVGTILQERNLHSVHVVGEFLDVRLQLCKGWRMAEGRVRLHGVQQRPGDSAFSAPGAPGFYRAA